MKRSLWAIVAALAASTPPAAAGQTSAAPPPVARADTGRMGYTAADVDFMSGMIHHHAQAVLMAGWAPTPRRESARCGRCASASSVGQHDEIALMQRWLARPPRGGARRRRVAWT